MICASLGSLHQLLLTPHKSLMTPCPCLWYYPFIISQKLIVKCGSLDSLHPITLDPTTKLTSLTDVLPFYLTSAGDCGIGMVYYIQLLLYSTSSWLRYYSYHISQGDGRGLLFIIFLASNSETSWTHLLDRGTIYILLLKHSTIFLFIVHPHSDKSEQETVNGHFWRGVLRLGLQGEVSDFYNLPFVGEYVLEPSGCFLEIGLICTL